MKKRTFGICQAKVQDEFPGWADEDGELIGGYITQVEDITNPHDASEVVGWFSNEELAAKVVRLLNGSKR